ncbi:hypothetical protein XENORESO_018405, partial [Xenotaenia resolanae]
LGVIKPGRSHRKSCPSSAHPEEAGPLTCGTGRSSAIVKAQRGELGLRFRELPCSRGGCGSDEDDRLSVMSWRSAASCSAASVVLERAQKRRDNFWGKR